MILEIGIKARDFGLMNLEDPEKWLICQLMKVNSLMSDSSGYLI